MDSDPEAVLAAANRRAAALARQDWSALERALHPEFRYVNAEGKRLSRDQYLGFVRDSALRWNEQRLKDVDVGVTGPTAVLTAEVHDDVEFGGERHELVFASTQTYVLEDGRWLYLAGRQARFGRARARSFRNFAGRAPGSAARRPPPCASRAPSSCAAGRLASAESLVIRAPRNRL